MIISIGYLSPENKVLIQSLNTSDQSLQDKFIDSASLSDENLNLLFLSSEESQSIVESEQKFYPIVLGSQLNISFDDFSSLNYDQAYSLYNKVNNPWILSRNIESIESTYTNVNYFKDLWINDRNSFFEELWFYIKTNLATLELTIIFNDLKEPTEKQAEKGDKPQLCHSFVKGQKLPQIFDGTEAEEKLMQEYEREFTEAFNITEYNSELGQLVFCSNIDKSPILVMAQMANFNQVQKSVLIALFSGLQQAN